MNPWTTPRAYIIKMDSKQLAQMTKASAERAAKAYAEYVQRLAGGA